MGYQPPTRTACDLSHINLKEELVPGQKISLTLNFEKSDPMKVEAEIREMGESMGHDMDGMDDDMEEEGHEMDMEDKENK